ncbi:MAG: hypothetical protein ACOC5T_07825 [Elusimicrobiota bacterium]
MNNIGGIGIASAILLVCFLLIAATVTSVIMVDSEDLSEEDVKKMVKGSIDEISTYIQIKDVVGRYYSNEGKQRIEKIAILINPLFSVDIDISELLIKINNGEQIKMLSYSNQADFIDSYSLFEHPIWNSIDGDGFNFVVTLDKDRSLVDHNVINDHSDMTYIIIRLPEEFAMKKGDTVTITLFLSRGITKTISLEAPLPMKRIVSLR